MKNKNSADNQTYYMPIGMCIGSMIDAQNRKSADVSSASDGETPDGESE